MTTPRLTVLLVTALLVLAGCIVEPRPYGYYRTSPGGVVYAPQPPVAPPVGEPAAPTTIPAAAQPAMSQETPPGMPPIPSQEQPEVLTRGPVHEAFAQPVAVQIQPDVVVASQPPANIVETPPVDRPAGGTCVWAPGYWSWDAERNNYIWVSGCWRLAPPKMTWVPGYWTRVPAGWQWVPGFWSPANAQEIAYLPAPPAVTDILPPGTPPTPDEFWVPGCWYWYQGRYAHRAGYWLHQQPGWIWSPSYCTWTPRGYVFVDGHWDYTLERRGVLFAPVCFPGRVSIGASFAFSPSITLDVGVLSASLFACPRYAHYYFGDYYDDAYVQIGIYPWFDCVRIGSWYDPVFVYARWDHGRTDPRWEEREHHEYTRRHDDRNLRPPRTYREQEARVARLPESQRHEQQMAQPLHTVVTAPAASGKFEHVDATAHQKIVQQTEETHNLRDARSRRETVAPAPQTPPSQHAPDNTRSSTRTTPSVPLAPAPQAQATQPATDNTTRPPTRTTPSVPSTPAPQTPVPLPSPGATRQPNWSAPVSQPPANQPSVDNARSSGRTAPAAYSPPARDTTPVAVQPDRVRLPASTGTEPATTTRGSERTERGSDRGTGNPSQPSDDTSRRDR